MGQYIDKPGIDTAEILDNGRLYPVVMSIPLSGSGTADSAGAVPGFEIPPFDTIIAVEDATERMVSVTYRKSGSTVMALNFTYDFHSFVTPYKTTTISKGA